MLPSENSVGVASLQNEEGTHLLLPYTLVLAAITHTRDAIAAFGRRFLASVCFMVRLRVVLLGLQHNPIGGLVFYWTYKQGAIKS